MNQQHVVHRFPPSGEWSPIGQTGGAEIDSRRSGESGVGRSSALGEAGEVAEPSCPSAPRRSAGIAAAAEQHAEGGEVRVANSSPTTRRPAGPQHRAISRRAASGSGTRRGRRSGRPHRPSHPRTGDRSRHLGRLDVRQATAARRLDHVVEELLLEVEDLNRAARTDPLRHVECVVTRPRPISSTRSPAAGASTCRSARG